MAQTTADRQQAAKKAAATRHGKQASESLADARRHLSSAATSLNKAAESGRDAAAGAARSVATRVQATVPGL